MKSGWQKKKIGEVCNLMTGGTPSRRKPEYFGGEIRWLVSGDINLGEIFDCEGRITEIGMKNSNAKLLPLNSVMIALNGQGKTRGMVALLRTRATCNQSLVSIYPKEPEKLLSEYLYTNLHGRYQEIRQMTGDSGNDRRGLNMALIKSIEIPIPPLQEQRRIVSVLDQALEGIATAAANAEKNLANAREVFDSYLQDEFESLGREWGEKSLHDLASPDCSLSYGIVQPGDDFEGGLPVVRPTNLINKIITLDGLKRIKPSLADAYKRTTLHGNELLLCVRGSTGAVSVASKELAGANVTRGIVPIRFNPELISQEYGYYSLISSHFQLQVKAKTYGAALMQINIADLRKITIPIPNLQAQKKIVEVLDKIYTETQHLQAIYQQKMVALDELKKSILKQAFTGGLN